MGKYFGTDGVRGKVNDTLTNETAYKIGQYLGYINKSSRTKIIIGKDPRLSSDMLENSVAAGICSTGTSVELIGYCPTPCVSYNLSLSDNYSFGIMISASHNPYYDNGIKVFNNKGFKLEATIENQIEEYIDGHNVIELAKSEEIGKIIYNDQLLNIYKNYLIDLFDYKTRDFKVVIDCSNGSASYTAYDVLKKLNVDVHRINYEPNGTNINNNCGSTHIDSLVDFIKDNKGLYDIGFAFDGDADRLIAVSSNGKIIDGDYILYICSLYLKNEGKLNKNYLVTTVMANIGLFKSLAEKNIDVDVTPVGDKYVYESMINNDYVIGGEQSGHIIFKDLARSGDGLLTALMLLKIMCDTNKSIDDLSLGLTIYPQLLVNYKVKDKNIVLNDNDIIDLINNIEQELGDNGRILVRPSGTEPIIRVMVEAKSDELCNEYVYRVIDLIKIKKY